MRDEPEQDRAIRYIDSNPVKARLCREPKNWTYGSARFRDEYHRLTLSS